MSSKEISKFLQWMEEKKVSSLHPFSQERALNKINQEKLIE